MIQTVRLIARALFPGGVIHLERTVELPFAPWAGCALAGVVADQGARVVVCRSGYCVARGVWLAEVHPFGVDRDAVAARARFGPGWQTAEELEAACAAGEPPF